MNLLRGHQLRCSDISAADILDYGQCGQWYHVGYKGHNHIQIIDDDAVRRCPLQQSHFSIK